MKNSPDLNNPNVPSLHCTVKLIVGWDQVLNSARTTVGKEELNREPSEKFKKQILISEHSPIRNLLFEVVWGNLPYWVSVHLARHHIGFHSGEDDLVFVETQRSDRTGDNRDNMPQDAPVTFRGLINAHSLINISRVRLCSSASKETREAWSLAIKKVGEIEPLFLELCKKNCIYRGFCPESNGCGYIKTKQFKEELDHYRDFCKD